MAIMVNSHYCHHGHHGPFCNQGHYDHNGHSLWITKPSTRETRLVIARGKNPLREVENNFYNYLLKA